MRRLQTLLIVTAAVFASGVPQGLAALTAEECCEEACDGALDGKHCPPHCDRGLCANVHLALSASGNSLPGPWSSVSQAVDVTQSSPVLPVVIEGAFHPPRA